VAEAFVAMSKGLSTPTSFDMIVMNKMSRLHLCLGVLRYVPGMLRAAGDLVEVCTTLLNKHSRFICGHLEDLPGIAGWSWSDSRGL
jgi:xylulose-5-phosphate/fructose-6-phosphate phosphoketolase